MDGVVGTAFGVYVVGVGSLWEWGIRQGGVGARGVGPPQGGRVAGPPMVGEVLTASNPRVAGLPAARQPSHATPTGVAFLREVDVVSLNRLDL